MSQSVPDFNKDIDEMMADLDQQNGIVYEESKKTQTSEVILHENDTLPSPVKDQPSIESLPVTQLQKLDDDESTATRNLSVEEAAEDKNDPFDEDPSKKDVNLIRARTFNDDLRSLVNRIKDNEPVGGAIDFSREIEDLDNYDSDELMLQLHRLFYKTKNLKDNSEINISCNPLEIKKEIAEKGMYLALQDHLAEEFERLSMPRFAVLSYFHDKKCYSPTVNTLHDVDDENLTISLRDPLFHKIFTSKRGIIINSDDIRGDHFLEKKFESDGKICFDSLYIILVERITETLRYELTDKTYDIEEPLIPASILMIDLDRGKENEEVTSVLEQRLSVPLYICNDNHARYFKADNFHSFEYVSAVIDYLLALFVLKEDGIGMVIDINDRHDISYSYILQYLMIKLKRILFSDSAVISVSRTRILVLTDIKHHTKINKLFNEIRSLYPDTIEIDTFFSNECHDPLRIIKETIFGTT